MRSGAKDLRNALILPARRPVCTKGHFCAVRLQAAYTNLGAHGPVCDHELLVRAIEISPHLFPGNLGVNTSIVLLIHDEYFLMRFKPFLKALQSFKRCKNMSLKRVKQRLERL